MEHKTIMAAVGALLALGIIVAAAYALYPAHTGAAAGTTTTLQPPAAQQTATTTSSTTSTSSTTIPPTTTSTTTTTLPRYLPLNWTEASKCKESVLGMMNSIIVQIPDTFDGTWKQVRPQATLYVSCDGGRKIPADQVVYRGGNTVEKGNPVAGRYRFMQKCGHNAEIEAFKDCKELDAYLDWQSLDLVNDSL
jgi:hypothetical protein